MERTWGNIMIRLYAVCLALSLYGCAEISVSEADVIPTIFPDYADVTIPENIAPLNFDFDGEYDKMEVRVKGENGDVLSVSGRTADFPIRKWRKLLKSNTELEVAVTVISDNKAVKYLPFKWYITKDEADGVICYRRVDPGYEFYAKMGIYERDLTTFREKVLYENTNIPGSCVNCHSFRQGNPKTMQMHLRGNQGGTLILSDGQTRIFNMKNSETLGCVYPYWHPTGKYIAYSVNDIRQTFHNTPDEILEVYDLASDVVFFDVEKEELIVYPILKDTAAFETFPVFSPDGRTLYFCKAAARAEKEYREVRYSLCSISFDPETGTVGDSISVLFSRKDASVSFPRPSYDGKYLLFTLSSFGNFSIWHKEADLYLMDLKSGEVSCAEALNSKDTESYHSWSTSSKWVAFSSRRIDGLYTRIYLSHIDGDGHFSKPFLIPQKNPSSNDRLLQSYNIPEFVTGMTDIPVRKITDNNRKVIKVTTK